MESSNSQNHSLAGVRCIDARHISDNQTCCYLLIENNEAALVDCGAKNGIHNILHTVDSAGLSPQQLRWIILTHAHFDHAGAAGVLQQHFPQATVCAHADTLKHLIAPDKITAAVKTLYGAQFFNAEYGEITPVKESRACAMDDNDTLDLGGNTLTFLYTPGHAWNHLSIYDERRNLFYAGDAYGICYLPPAIDGSRFIVPVMPPSHFNPAALKKSLRRLRDLNADYAALAHYGIIANAPALANQQITATEEWAAKAQDIDKQGNFYNTFSDYLIQWYRDATAHFAYEEVRQQHKHDIMLTVKGFAHWLKNTT